MKRYYLSRIKQVEEPGMGLVWKHRLQELPNVEYLGGEIAVDPTTGVPTQKALLCLVAGVKHKNLIADAELVPLPMVSHDIKVSSIHTPTKLAAKAAIKGLGFTDAEIESVFTNADGFRDVVEHFGRLNNPAFNADDFDLYEN